MCCFLRESVRLGVRVRVCSSVSASVSACAASFDFVCVFSVRVQGLAGICFYGSAYLRFYWMLIHWSITVGLVSIFIIYISIDALYLSSERAEGADVILLLIYIMFVW